MGQQNGFGRDQGSQPRLESGYVDEGEIYFEEIDEPAPVAEASPLEVLRYLRRQNRRDDRRED